MLQNYYHFIKNNLLKEHLKLEDWEFFDQSG
jgi:hypothetical protein